jgi:hypothetical protein
MASPDRMRGQDSHETMKVKPFSGHRHRRGKASPQGVPGGRQVRGKTRLVDLSVGQTAPGASRRQSNRGVHRYESEAARKLAFIL